MANNEILAEQQLKGWDDTQANLISTYATNVPLAGEPIRSSDGWVTFGDGSTQLQNLKWFQFDTSTGNIRFSGSISIGRSATQAIDVYKETGSVYSLLETMDGSGAAGYRMKNTINEYIIYNNSFGSVVLRDITNSISQMLFEPNCPADFIYGYNTGIIKINGAFGIGTNGQVNITTGTYNSLSALETGIILANSSGGNITINGLSGCEIGQRILLIKTSAVNNLILTDESASGTPQKLLVRGGTRTKTGDYSQVELVGASSGFITVSD